MFRRRISGTILAVLAGAAAPAPAADRYEGRFFAGEGDVEYLQLLDVSRRMFAPDPEFQNVPMLYTHEWNGLCEGPTWNAWWIQNSYGTTYSALPFLEEPLVTFLQNSQDLWFDQMGDGRTVRPFQMGNGPRFDWVPPDGCLCDAARPGWFVAKQGDGRVEIHDWAMEFTAAGIVLQAELLLISRDADALAKYLPKLERCAGFLETRRDPANNLFLAGAAANLLAPSYAGWKRPDGSFGHAYLAGLSITYIAALDRLVELEKLAGQAEKVRLYSDRREAARKGLSQLLTDEGYFIRSIDPDGTRHGVHGAPRHGYFEASPNHDAIALRIVDDAIAERIYAKIASLPGLRRHDLIIANDPGYDDMYQEPTGIWQFGHWVNGGHWSTCEARMILAYNRLARHEDARRSMRRMLRFARDFRLDNPLTNFGSEVYQPNEPINLCYDSFGPAAALVRGLFEYLYRADALTILPHIPTGITTLEQRFPIRFGSKRLFLATTGCGDVTRVLLNGSPWDRFEARSVTLPYAQIPDTSVVAIGLGHAPPSAAFKPVLADEPAPLPPAEDAFWTWPAADNLISANELPLRIGADSNGQNGFVGDIAWVRLYRRALSADEIAASAATPKAAPSADPSMLGDWQCGDADGGRVPNRANAELSALIQGEVDFPRTSDGRLARLNGKGWLEVAHAAALNLTAQCTIEARIRPAALPPGGGRILDKSRAGTSDGYLLDTHPGNSLRMIVAGGAIGHDARLQPGFWHHVAATIDARGRQTLYLNGKPVASQSIGGPALPSETARRIARFYDRLKNDGLEATYEAAHARLVLAAIAAARQRKALLEAGRLSPLSPRSQTAADHSYIETVSRLCAGLQAAVEANAKGDGEATRKIRQAWQDSIR